jgi:hypothetical protein
MEHHQRRSLAALYVMEAHAVDFDEASGRGIAPLRLPGALVDEGGAAEERRGGPQLDSGSGLHAALRKENSCPRAGRTYLAASASNSTLDGVTYMATIMNDAKEVARSKFSEQQSAAAASLGDFAGALRKSADEMQGKHQSAARFAQSAAGGLEQLSGALKNRDLEGMLRDAEGFARRQPAAFFGAAVLAGFLAVRFLKSSNSSPAARPGSAGAPVSGIPSNEI